MGLPRWLSGKESACQCRRGRQETWLDSWGARSGKGNGNPLQYSCLENPMDRGAWWATVHEVARVRHHLASEHVHTHICTQLIYNAEFQVYSKVNQLYICMYPLFKILFCISYYSVLSRVPCAIQ
ncbi:unnamed protein product [Rangifer tarandus platyrhynchus]|uniref:Uncharacterized protein n=1 Tax=Rangifer tarandus platyrhynchus TaxID=3082113 RepID=A0AC59ZXF6_RANTA